MTLGSRAPEVKLSEFSLTAKLPPIKLKTEKTKPSRQTAPEASKQTVSAVPKQTVPEAPPQAADEGLLEKLRTLRTEIAREEKVPPYIVFSEGTLKDMCAKMPLTREAFLDVSGVGNAKVQKYFERFHTLISEHKESISNTPDTDIFALLKEKDILLSSSPLSVPEFCVHIAKQLKFTGSVSQLDKRLIAYKPNPNVLRRYLDSDSVGREIYAPRLATGAQEWVFERLRKL
jgi:hypothetical protein